MIDEQQAELASLYAAGALPPLEAKEFEAAMEANAELRQFTAQLRDASAALALSASSVAPPPALREKVLAAVNRPEKVVRLDFKDQKPAGWKVWLPWAMAAGFALCAMLFFQKYRTTSHDFANRVDQNDAQGRVIDRLKNEKAMLEKAIEDYRVRIAGIGQQLEMENRQLTIASNEIARLERQFSEARPALLTAQADAPPKIIAVSLWDAKRQEGMLVGQDFAPLPADKDYQLWVFDQGKPVAAGVLKVDGEGRTWIVFKPDANIGSAEQFAVSIEKKGGEQKVGNVPAAPKGKVVLAGKWL
jgi:anti-sigma-K factor RskA